MGEWITKTPIAHRGLHDGVRAPENSIPAFQEATRQGFPIELDVHLLRDGRLVVFHDDELERMTGSPGLVSEQDSRTVGRMRLLGGSHSIPLFEDVLEVVDGSVPLLIEIKNKAQVGELERTLHKVLRDYAGPVAVQSFNPMSVAWFAQNAPDILRGQLSGDFRDSSIAFYKKFLLRRLLLNGRSRPHFIAYDLRCLPYRWVDWETRRRRIPVLAWTVRSEAEKERAMTVAGNVIFEGFVP